MSDSAGARAPKRVLLRIGAVCAILGAVVSVAAGANFDNLTVDATADVVVGAIAARPAWYWPTVQLGFGLGALLWVGAFVALAGSFATARGRELGSLAVASIVVGATLHLVDSSISGAGLAALARDWAVASPTERAELLRAVAVLLRVLGGTWPGVLALFHGVPFILMGLAVALDRRYPAWLGGIGVIGGVGSLVLGTALFLGTVSLLYIAFAVVVSAWMVVMGLLMWRAAGRGTTIAPPATGGEQAPPPRGSRTPGKD